MNFEHENVIAIKHWLDRNNIFPTTDPDVIINIYTELQYTGKIVSSASFTDRVRICKMQYDFILKSMMVLMYENNGKSAKGIKGGYVYAIHNPAWPEYVKIGSAIDVYGRLNTYQTSSPFRDYEILGYVFSNDRLALEKSIHDEFDRYGEWIKADKEKMKKFLSSKKSYPIGLINQFCLDEMIHNAGMSDKVISTKKFRHKCIEVVKQILQALISSGRITDSADELSNHLIKRNNIKILSKTIAYDSKYDIMFIKSGDYIHTIV